MRVLLEEVERAMSVHASEQKMRVMKGRDVDGVMVYSKVIQGSKLEVQRYLRENPQDEDLRVEVFIRGDRARGHGAWICVRLWDELREDERVRKLLEGPIPPEDLKVEYCRSSNKVNESDCFVRLTHIPTGRVGIGADYIGGGSVCRGKNYRIAYRNLLKAIDQEENDEK